MFAFDQFKRFFEICSLQTHGLAHEKVTRAQVIILSTEVDSEVQWLSSSQTSPVANGDTFAAKKR